jgi:anti-anti-sigma factor
LTPELAISPSGPSRFTLRGVLDVSTASTLERRMATMPIETSVVLDLAGVDFMDSVGLATIARIAEHLDAVVILEAPTPGVARFLDVTDPTWRGHALVRPKRAGGPRSAAARHATRAKPVRPIDPLLDWS